MDINTILIDRNLTHGNFMLHATISQSLKDVLYQESRYLALSKDKKEALDMILHKIARIVAGDANYVDHWIDISGYATLVSSNLQNTPPDIIAHIHEIGVQAVKEALS